MHIIFGEDQAQALAQKYTVLELDTIKTQEKVVTAFCVVENVPISDLHKVESMRKLHSELMVNYRQRDWNFCDQALEHLYGFWNHELDTFYEEIRKRIDYYTQNDPGDNWDGIIVKQ